MKLSEHLKSEKSHLVEVASYLSILYHHLIRETGCNCDSVLHTHSWTCFNDFVVYTTLQSVLELSHEIDVLQRESSHSELQSVEKIRHFINMEKESLSARFQMEVQIMDALSAHGLSKDGILIKVPLFLIFLLLAF